MARGTSAKGQLVWDAERKCWLVSFTARASGNVWGRRVWSDVAMTDEVMVEITNAVVATLERLRDGDPTPLYEDVALPGI